MTDIVRFPVVSGNILDKDSSEKAWYVHCEFNDGTSEDFWVYAEMIGGVIQHLINCGWMEEWIQNIERDPAYDGPESWPHDIHMRREPPLSSI